MKKYNFLIQKLYLLSKKNPYFCFFKIYRKDGIIEEINAKELYDKYLIYSQSLSSYKNAICAIYLDVSIDFLSFLLACFTNHCIPIICSYANEERKTFLNQINKIINIIMPDMIFTSSSCAKIAKEDSEIKYVFSPQYQMNFTNEAFQKRNFDFIQTSSGTTKFAKGLCLSLEGLYNNAQIASKAWEVDNLSILLSYLSYSHILGFVTGFILPFYTGCKCIIVDPLYVTNSKSKLFQIIEDEHITNSPLIISSVLSALNEGIHSDLSSLKYLILGGEVIPKDTYLQLGLMLNKHGLLIKSLINTYGMSECGFLTSQSIHDKVRIENFNGQEYVSVGHPCTNKTKCIIVDNNGNVLPDGNIGNIAVRSSSMAKKYIISNKEIKIQLNDINGERYYINNDIGFIKNNQLFICDRNDNVVIYNGKKYLSYYLENQIKETISNYSIKRILFFNIPNTINIVVCYLEMLIIDNDVKKDIVDLIWIKEHIKISDCFIGNVEKTGAMNKLSKHRVINEFINLRVGNLDDKETDKMYKESVGILKKNNEWYARTIIGDLPIDLNPNFLHSDKVKNGLYRFIIKSGKIIYMEQLKITNDDLIKNKDGHIFQLKPFYLTPKKDVIKLQSDFDQIDEDIIPNVLNDTYDEFYTKATKLWNWDIELPYVGSMTFFMYYDDEIVGALDFRYGLTDKLKYIGGHSGGGIMPKYRKSNMATNFFEFSFSIGKMLGLKTIRITCKRNNSAVKKIISKHEHVLIKSFNISKELIEDAYDIIL